MDGETGLADHTTSSQKCYGQRFLHLVFDDISIHESSRLYASVPISTNVTEGFRHLTFGDIAHCVDVFANSLETQIGRSIKVETVAYLGLPDVRNVVVFLAAVKCGYKVCRNKTV